MNTPCSTARELLRHTVATLAYRASKAVRDAPESFANFSVGPKTRTPVQIVAHLGDLFDWALSIAQGNTRWGSAEPKAWAAEVERFFAALAAFDAYLASESPLGAPADELFQGPVSDALTHVGQLTLLRGIAGVRVRPENYFKAKIRRGLVGRDQPSPVSEYGD
jgi:hypothetical protein